MEDGTFREYKKGFSEEKREHLTEGNKGEG